MAITIENITMAATNMEAMVIFYNAVFDAELKPQQPFGFKGTLAGFKFMLVPNEIAQTDARQNRQQIQFAVPDVEQSIVTALANGGKLIDEAAERGGRILGAVYDPDGNSIVFAQAE